MVASLTSVLTMWGGLRIRMNSLVCSKSVWAENEM